MLSRQTRPVILRAAARRNAQPTLPANLRAYAQAAAVQDTKPPVAVYGLDGTYANALVCWDQLAGCTSFQALTTTIPLVYRCSQNILS